MAKRFNRRFAVSQGEQMPSIKMLRPMFAYPDGITRKAYLAGEVYEIENENILMAIFEAGAGEMVAPKRKPRAAPQNKAAKPPQEDK